MPFPPALPGPRSRGPRPDGAAPRRRAGALGLALTAALAGTLLVAPGAVGADRVVARDAMERVVAGGLGDALVGGAWSTTTPRDLSVGGGVGTITLPAPGTARTATLASTGARDVLVGASFAVPVHAPAGGGYTVGVALRRTAAGDSYLARVRVAPGGETRLGLVHRAANGVTTDLAAETSLGRLAPGTWFRVEGRATGTDAVDLGARAWVRGQTAPAWQLAARDTGARRLAAAGSVGLFAYASSSSPAGRVLVDNVEASETSATTTPVTPPPVTPPPVTPPPVTPPPVTPTPTTPTSGREATRAGATVGSTRYAVPSGAVVVAPSGDDAAAGTAAAPLRTLARAVERAPEGGTVVLRGGSYHESLVLRKRLTVQSWPGEAVWLDGSSRVDGWTASGGAWTTRWTLDFDPSPTYTWGAGEAGAAAGWRFVDPAYPMAAHPDQVWVDGVAQVQVGSRDQLAPGRFYLDRRGDVLHLGTDPRGREVRVSDLQQAVNVRVAGATLRGLGVRRYAPSVPHMGAVTLEQPRATLEEVAVVDSATTGIAVSAADATLRHVTSSRSGMLGVTATYADRLLVDGLRAEGNNAERFNQAPVSGGIKIARSRGVTVRDSTSAGNRGPGVWLDESAYDIEVVGNDLRDNAGHGTSLELSAKAVFADNLVSGNGRDGIKVNNTSDVKIWNNTFTGNGRTLNVVQDPRRASDRGTPGHDPRQPFPDPTMTWLLGPVTVRNNVVADTASGNCLLCVEDYSKQRSAEQIGVTADGDVYHRTSPGTPTWAVVWSRGAGNPAVFTDLASFTRTTGQEGRGVLLTGADVVDAAGRPTGAFPGHSRAVGLPSDVAALVGQPTGTARVGAFGL